jgi:hypothetical protein
MLGTASGVAAVVVGAVFASGGTYATWNDDSAVATKVVTSATLSIAATESFDDSLWTNMIVGETVRQQFTVTNTGDIPVHLTGHATTGFTAFEIRLASGACTTAPLTGTAATASTKTLPDLAAGDTTIVCAEVKLTPVANPGDVVTFTITMTGTQVL